MRKLANKKTILDKYLTGPIARFYLLALLGALAACGDPNLQASHDGAESMDAPIRDSGDVAKVDGFSSGDGFIDEPPNQFDLDAGVPGGCEIGGLSFCPLSASPCRRCLEVQCPLGIEQCNYSLACVHAFDDYLHCRSDGRLLPAALVLCVGNCEEECIYFPTCGGGHPKDW